MKKITWFYMQGCPYCRNGEKAFAEILTEHPEYKDIPIQKVDERKEVAFADAHDYYYVPTLYLDEEKAYECSPQDSFNDIKQHFKEVLAKAFE
ncbi:thioredoxin family protein [Sharpea azabuensis]|uniref:Thioredoxin family protein n=2 Tax=Sharpea porci TaxID=2652286 RepID=A0A844FQI7_9FIRM|nr:thioredoxin family protein [Sharpea porci]